MHQFILSAGYLGLFVLTVAEAACIPIPSELTLTIAGALAASPSHHGPHLNIVAVIVVATVGELIGGFISWAIGRTGGRAAILKYGKYVFLDVTDLEKAEKFFAKRGALTVLIGRMLPVIRTFISLPAGTGDVPALEFGIFTLIGSAIWCTALALVGYGLGSTMQNTINAVLSNAGYAIAGVVVILIAIFFAHRFRMKKHEEHAKEVADSEIA
ncbi:MAG: DedA family protein [Acidimicrobiales bacterium]|nr:DedA family protein [Acidimicrobiales bacterium]